MEKLTPMLDELDEPISYVSGTPASGAHAVRFSLHSSGEIIPSTR
jgi:hypothetical protein